MTVTLDEIELEARVRFSISAEDVFGKCTSSYDLALPHELKEEARRQAALRRMSLGAFIRLALVNMIYGPDHVAMMVHKRLTGYPHVAGGNTPVGNGSTTKA